MIKRIFFFFTLVFVSLFGFSQTSDSTGVINDSVSLSDTAINNVDEVMDNIIAVDSAKFQKIKIKFIKKKVIQSTDSLYFNICKITNTTSEIYEGNFELRAPIGWNIIANPSAGITLSPGETKIFPVRLSIPIEAVGGIAYVVDASFLTSDGFFSGASYIKIPLKSDWDMTTERKSYYFNEYFDDIQFNIHIKNSGNAEELIKLKYKIGKLLSIDQVLEEEEYILIPPNTDSTITYIVRRSKLTENEEYLYQQVWNESIITITASSGAKKKIVESIRFVDLDNVYVFNRQEKASPLNMDVSIYNLLSNVKPRANLILHGQVLFNNDHDLSYIAQSRNIFYNSSNLGNYFSNPNNATFRLAYKWKDRVKAEVGEVNNYAMHSIRGWGARASYKINKKDKVTLAYNIGKYYPTWGVSAGYETKIKKVGAYVIGTYEDNKYLYFKAGSIEAGSDFNITSKHIFRVSLLGTNATFDKNLGFGTPDDTTVMGFAYRFNYNGSVKKFRFGVNAINHQYNYIRVRPSNYVYGYARYVINPKTRINVFANYNSIKSSKLTFNSFYKGAYNGQQIYRITFFHQLTGKYAIQAGPMYRSLDRLVINSADTVSSNFINYFYGLYGLVRIKFNNTDVLTPSMALGTTSFKNKLNPSQFLQSLPTFNVGANYVSRNWGASARYIYGPNFFLTEDFFDYDPTAFETIYMRANINKFYNNRTLQLTGYATYYLRLPENWQNFMLSTRVDLFLPQRWSAYLTGNIYTNSRMKPNEGIVSQRNFSMNVGVLKAFDIPQPRIKYYDITVVCFNDFNGNGEREDNEPLLSNIKMKVSMNKNFPNLKNIRFGEQELVTDPEGQLDIIDIPEGNFVFEFEPLTNLGNLYNSKGDVQEVLVMENMTLFVPYVESFKVKGRVILNRDEYSSKGLINVGGIRVTASTMDDQSFSALTDNEGNYLINVPQAGFYTVKVNNIFGEEFEIDKEEFLIQFNGFKTFNVDFTFFEGKRKVNFSGTNFFNFSNSSSGGGSTRIDSTNVDGSQVIDPINVDGNLMQKKEDLNTIIEAVSNGNIASIPNNIDPNKVKFMVEIGVYADGVPVEVVNKMIELKIVPTPIQSAGVTIYATQVVGTHDEVVKLHDKIVKTGFTQALIVGSYDGKVISEQKAIEFKKQ